jgi:RimJ/RimL family protein N-acetyltransferase
MADDSALSKLDPASVALRTERLLLRPWRERDIDAITAECQDAEIQRFVPVPAPYSRSDAEYFVHEVLARGLALGTDIVFGAFSAQTGAVVASVGLHQLQGIGSPLGGSGEIGYWAAASMRGQGYMTEAASAVCRWGLELGLARIQWRAMVGNDASWRVVEKLGFRLEGTLRSASVMRGTRVDMWIGSLLRNEARFELGGSI